MKVSETKHLGQSVAMMALFMLTSIGIIVMITMQSGALR